MSSMLASGVPSDIKHPDKKLKARGLTLYVSDIRNCATREDEEKRVMQELSHIRAKFSTKQQVTSYDKRKYIWKLVYSFLLGYEIDFGHMQIIELIASVNYQEKMVGYIALSILFKSSDDLMTLVFNTLKLDLFPKASENEKVRENVQCLALHCVANIGGREMALTLAEDVKKLVFKDETISSDVKKKAILAYLRLLRDSPDLEPVTELEVARIIESDSAKAHLGLCLSACALLKHLISRREHAILVGVQSAGKLVVDEENSIQDKQRPQVQAITIRTLSRLASERICPTNYYYHGTPAPWLQVALLQILNLIKVPPQAKEIAANLFISLSNILKNVKWSKSSTMNNATRCISFEAIALIVKYSLIVKPELVNESINLLGRYATSKNPNTRYLSLTTMVEIARTLREEGEEEDGGLPVPNSSSSSAPWWGSLKGT